MWEQGYPRRGLLSVLCSPKAGMEDHGFWYRPTYSTCNCSHVHCQHWVFSSCQPPFRKCESYWLLKPNIDCQIYLLTALPALLWFLFFYLCTSIDGVWSFADCCAACCELRKASLPYDMLMLRWIGLLIIWYLFTRSNCCGHAYLQSSCVRFETTIQHTNQFKAGMCECMQMPCQIQLGSTTKSFAQCQSLPITGTTFSIFWNAVSSSGTGRKLAAQVIKDLRKINMQS